jgi:Flp pilus assembly protein TadG
MIEFSLVFLIFLVLVVGLMEIGRAVWMYTTIAHATRRGARYAALHGSSNPVLDGGDNDVTDTEIANRVKANVIGLDTTKIVVSAPVWTPDRSRGSVVELTVTYPFELVTGNLIVSQKSLALKSTTRVLVAN